MENNNGWLEHLSYQLTDPQQQTYVTKHDLALLHKKIIATDLIVQKYQEANKALLSLQVENDHLRQQIEQITNECCIFGKQVTECTQECDSLQEQIDLLTTEKRELHNQIRRVQDENTNLHHEVMVLTQYESLKDINDQSTKTIERQQKEISRLQLKVQRHTPIIYKPTITNREPSATDVALTNSQKSVLELRLALARLMNFIELSKLEIPTALRIRPVLKAHDINDNFLEAEGEFVLQRKRRKSKPVVTSVVVPAAEDDDDDDDDDENGDFIDVPPLGQAPTVGTSAPLVDSSKDLPTSSSGEQAKKKQGTKKKETTKKPKTPKSSKRKRRNTEEHPASELDDLVNDLEKAISQPDQPIQATPVSHSISFFSDEEEEEVRRSQSSQPPIPQPTYQPTSLPQPVVPRTITRARKPTSNPVPAPITRELSSLSDDETDDRRPPPSPAPVFTPVIERMPTRSSIVIEKPVTRLQHRAKASSDLRTSISMLSEDDDREPPQVLSPAVMQPTARSPSPVYEDPPTMDEPIQIISVPPVDDMSQPLSQSDIHPWPMMDSPMADQPQDQPSSVVQDVSSLSTAQALVESPQHLPEIIPEKIVAPKIGQPQEPSSVAEDVPSYAAAVAPIKRPQYLSKTIPEKIGQPQPQPSSVAKDLPAFPTTEVPVKSPHHLSKTIPEKSVAPKPVNTLDRHKIDLVLRLLHLLRQVPNRLEPLRLSPRRSRPKKILQEKLSVERLSLEILPKPVETSSIVMEEVHVDPPEEPVLEQVTPMEEELTKLVEIDQVQPDKDATMTAVSEDQHEPVEETVADDSAVIEVSSTIEYPQELPPVVNETPSSVVRIEVEKTPAPVSTATANASALNPAHAAIIVRLLRVLTTLPIMPTRFPQRLPVPTRKQTAPVVTKSSIPPVQPASNQISRSPPPRMHTRSLSTIQACITRCNRPTTASQKRTTNDSVSSAAPKRMKPSTSEMPQDEYAPLKKFLHTFAKEINTDLKTMIERKLTEDSSLFIDHLNRLITEIIMGKGDILLPLVKQLHPFEETLRILFTYMNSKSTVFQQNFLQQSKQAFVHQIQEKQASSKPLKTLNRLFFLTCSTFTPPSPVIVYARLFDLGYSSSQEVLLDALLFVQHACASLLPINVDQKSSNRLLHRVLFEMFAQATIQPSLEYVEHLLTSYSPATDDREDLLRCFLLICRHQSWTWCSQELCSKLLLPMVTRVNQRLTILTVLQYLLFMFEDNEQFRQDALFHDQVKQALKTNTNAEESIVRDKILSILQTPPQIKI